MKWRYPYTVLLLCTLAFMTTMVARLAISPLVPAITDDFGVSNAAFGLALTLMWGAYALIQFPSGILGERFGERRVILSSLGITGLGSVLLAFSPTFEFFVLFVFLLGIGAGLHYTVATTFIANQFDEIGRAIGFHITGSPVAGLTAPIAAVAIASQFGWRAGVLLGAITAIPMFGLFLWRIHPTEPTKPNLQMRDRIEVGSVLELLSRPSIAYTTVLAILCAFVWQATASFLPTFFTERHGLSPALASVLFSVYFVVHGLTQPVLGSLSDRIGRDPTLALGMVAGTVGFGTLAIGQGRPVFFLGVLLVGVAMSWGSPLQSRYLDQFGPDEKSSGFGLVRTVYMTTGALGSVVVGFVADIVGWGVSFALLMVIMFVVFTAISVNAAFRLGL